MATLPASTGVPPCAPFNPAAWLARFEAVGGGYAITDRLSLMYQVEHRTDEELSMARQLIIDLTSDGRSALVDYLRGRA